jgi:hypothetical protein
MKLALLAVGLVALVLLLSGPLGWAPGTAGLLGGLFGTVVGVVGGVFGLAVGVAVGIFGAVVGLLAGLFGAAVALVAVGAVFVLPLLLVVLVIYGVARSAA